VALERVGFGRRKGTSGDGIREARNEPIFHAASFDYGAAIATVLGLRRKMIPQGTGSSWAWEL